MCGLPVLTTQAKASMRIHENKGKHIAPGQTFSPRDRVKADGQKKLYRRSVRPAIQTRDGKMMRGASAAQAVVACALRETPVEDGGTGGTGGSGEEGRSGEVPQVNNYDRGGSNSATNKREATAFLSPLQQKKAPANTPSGRTAGSARECRRCSNGGISKEFLSE